MTKCGYGPSFVTEIQTMFRVTKVVLLLPPALILMGGGMLSVCDLLLLSGMNPHHHADTAKSAVICISDCGHHEDSERQEFPCPEDCHIPVPDAETVKDTGYVFGVQPRLLPWTDVNDGNRSLSNRQGVGIQNRAPPGYLSRLVSSTHTGRFLL